MKVSIVGTGYVGLVSGVCLAELGHHVTCIDRDSAKIEMILGGKSPIYEPGLDELLQKNLGGRFTATTDLPRAIHDTELTLIAVGTPFDGKRIDLSAVEGAARETGLALKTKDQYHTVVVKSTVVPGTTERLVMSHLEEASGKKADAEFGVSMNPEFLREGAAVSDFMEPDRIVCGAIGEKSRAMMRELYAVFPDIQLVETNCRTAEMIKYSSNALLATMISFSNEIANLCSAVGDVDVMEVTGAVHLDKRLSPIMPDGERVVPGFTTYIVAGCGFGGSCFPKDVKALIEFGNSEGAKMQMLEAVIDINEKQPTHLIDLLRIHYPDINGLRVAVLGFAFKPGTDDIRQSPALTVVEQLLEEGASIVGFDPIAEDKAREYFGERSPVFQSDLKSAIDGVDAIIIITRWPEFEAIPALLEPLGASQPVVIDGRRMLDKNSVARYEGIGIRRENHDGHRPW